MKLSLAFLRPATLVSATLALASCSTMSSIKTTTTSGVSKMGAGIGSGVSKMGEGIGNGFGKVADLTTSPFRPAVPVVEAREDDLKELESGEDKALAYQRNNGFWSFFGGPVDFEEPTLPDDGGAIDGGLLPPIE